MTKEEQYIQSLEALVCFYSEVYQACKSTYVSENYKGELTECKKEQLTNFPFIQGARLIQATEGFAKIKIELKIPAMQVLKTLKEKHNDQRAGNKSPKG